MPPTRLLYSPSPESSYLFLDEYNEYINYDYPLPTYLESKLSPRCEEDISNPAPSYNANKVAIQSGADKLAEWFTAETRRMFRKG